MINVVLKPEKEIQVSLKPEQGIQIEATKKYLFDPTVVQPYVDVSAENATKAEEQANKAEQVFTDVTVFVDNSKTEINEIIEQSKTDINTAVDNGRMEISDSILEATEEVKKAGSEAAQEAVQGAADEATRIATEQVNTYVVEVVSPQIQEFVNNAEADASNAAESAGLAAEEANKSSVFASDSQHYAEDARIWAEGEQAEVKPLGGELSSMGAADLAYAIANAPEDTPIDVSGLFAMNVVKGPKGDKGDKGEDGKEFDALNFLSLIYPVGSIYISTTSTCPIQDFGIGTWELVAADRVLQGAGTRGAVGTQLAESLPQHTHTRGSMEISGTLGASGNKVAIGNTQDTNLGVSGVFTQSNRTNWLGYAGGGGGYSQGCTVTFTASRNWTGSTSNASGSTYQSNAKVQQDAYLVNIFRRVA